MSDYVMAGNNVKVQNFVSIERLLKTTSARIYCYIFRTIKNSRGISMNAYFLYIFIHSMIKMDEICRACSMKGDKEECA
jgi:hypothetical protein